MFVFTDREIPDYSRAIFVFPSHESVIKRKIRKSIWIGSGYFFTEQSRANENRDEEKEQIYDYLLHFTSGSEHSFVLSIETRSLTDQPGNKPSGFSGFSPPETLAEICATAAVAELLFASSVKRPGIAE
ncbi:MAG: hypothetical protein ABIQ32_11515 [Sphingomicrobium sp.]